MVTGDEDLAFDLVLTAHDQIYILETHETLPQYMRQVRDANLRHCDLFKSALRVVQNSWQTAGTYMLLMISHVFTIC